VITIGDGTDDIRKGGWQDICANRGLSSGAQRAHQCFPQVTGTPSNKELLHPISPRNVARPFGTGVLKIYSRMERIVLQIRYRLTVGTGPSVPCLIAVPILLIYNQPKRIHRFKQTENERQKVRNNMTEPRVEQPTLGLDAYFRRIGYSGTRTATLDTLQAIVQHHTQVIPFENLNPYLRLPVKLDLESLQTKLVHSRRGGFCFEQNGLLRQVLLALGFESKPLGARVIWGQPPGYMPPRTHMVQLLTIDGEPYMADVGFGGMTPTAPLRLEPGLVQETPHEPFRFVREGEEYIMEALVGDTWRALYRFDLVAQQVADYELGNFWVCHHPDSHFISGVSAARVEPGRRYALRNNNLAIHHTGGISEEQVLTSTKELHEVLEQIFCITVPTEVDTHAAFQPLIA